MIKPVKIGTLTVSESDFVFIAGPCVVETLAMTLAIATHLADVAAQQQIQLIFKASVDKANRSSGRSFRGRGWRQGLQTLAKVRERTGLPVTTDIHESWQAAEAATVVDLIQIPALLCRQTDLLVAAAKTGLPVNVKKGQFMPPVGMRHVLAKLTDAGCDRVLFTERGSCFGYNGVVVDMRGLAGLSGLGTPAIFDASHTVQVPGLVNTTDTGSSGSERHLIRPLARAAVAFGCQGVFVETHPDPDNALSDGLSSLHLNDFFGFVDDVLAIRYALNRPKQ